LRIEDSFVLDSAVAVTAVGELAREKLTAAGQRECVNNRQRSWSSVPYIFRTRG